MASLIQRKGTYYIQWCTGGKPRRRSLRTRSLQVAKEHLRQFESARFQGDGSPLPTRTPVAEVLDAYVQHIRTIKTAKSAQTDIYYLREAFGPICVGLKITSRRVTERSRKRPLNPDAVQDHRARGVQVEADAFELITTGQLDAFLTGHVRRRGLAPKTANRYREILVRIFNWAMKTGRVKMPGDRNPAVDLERYRERAPQIRYLQLPEIQTQLETLDEYGQLQAMVAVLIYAGLRREELVWLTADNVDLQAGTRGMIRIQAKTVQGETWQPKTRVNRAVPISSDLRPYLDRYSRRPAHGDWYFPSPKAVRWDPDNFSRHLRQANLKAGLTWSCLDYRHTFGSRLAQNGVSLYKIATLMGNSPEICRRHYAALTPASMSKDVEFGSEQTVHLTA